MYDAEYVAMMLDLVLKRFIEGTYASGLVPNVVDSTLLDAQTVEITMTDETVFIAKVTPLDMGGGRGG